MPGCKSSNEILVKNAQNLLQTILHGVHAAETACMTVNITLELCKSCNIQSCACDGKEKCLNFFVITLVIKETFAVMMKGLKQPEPNSDGAEATALCFQWRRKLEIHRAQETTYPDTDELGLRKTSSHPVAPSLAPSGLVTTTLSKHK